MNLSQITHCLTERRAAMLAGAVETLEAGVAVGSIRNVDFNDAKDTVNRAIEEAAGAFLKAGPHVVGRDGKPHHQSDYWLSAYDADAFVSGASNVASALKRAQKTGDLNEYAAFLAALMPIVELVQTAKPLIVKRQDQPKVISPKVAAKLAKSMTCQCCGRAIFAETGLIAHHGYQRPGGGWQTASCAGARELPFEVSRDALGRLIESLKRWEGRAVAALAAVANGLVPVVLTLTNYDKPRDPRTGYRPTKSVDVTRANFAEVKAANPKASLVDFDGVKASDISRRAQEIAGVRDEIKAQTARFDGWKQTHFWAGDAWKAV